MVDFVDVDQLGQNLLTEFHVGCVNVPARADLVLSSLLRFVRRAAREEIVYGDHAARAAAHIRRVRRMPDHLF